MKIYVDDDTQKRLEAIAREPGRTVADLATAAVEEAALDYFRNRKVKDDPAHKEDRR